MQILRTWTWKSCQHSNSIWKRHEETLTNQNEIWTSKMILHKFLPQSTPRNILLGQLFMFACFFVKCAGRVHSTRDSHWSHWTCVALDAFGGETYRGACWGGCYSSKTNGAIIQLCFVLFWKKFTSVLSLFIVQWPLYLPFTLAGSCINQPHYGHQKWDA